MTTVRKLNLSGGEVSPALYPRTDTSKFQAGFRTARNYYVRKDGAMDNRQGGEFTCETRNNKKIYVTEFKVQGQPSFKIEFSDLKIRILQKGKPVNNDSHPLTDIVGITKAATGVLTYNNGGVDDFSNDTEIFITGVKGMHQINNRSYLVKNVDTVAKTFELADLDGNPIDTTNYGTFVTGTGVIRWSMVLTAPYIEEHIPYLDHDQSIDAFYIVHPEYAPRQLIRGTSSWSLSLIAFSPTVPPVMSGLTMTVAPGSGSVGPVTYAVTGVNALGQETLDSNITANANLSPTGTYYNQLGWNPDAVGITYYIYKRVDGVYGLIGTVVSQATGYQANMFRDVGVVPDTTHSIPTLYNPFDGAGNWPSAVCFFQQRTVFANTKNKPETVFASRVGIYNSFIKRSPGDPIRDDDSIEFNLAGRFINPVHHLFDLNGLLMNTETSEQYLGTEPMTPSTIHPVAQSYNGSGPGMKPLPMNDTLIYLQNLGSVVRELGFQYEVDGYRGDDLTTFANHLFKNKKLVSWSFQQIPHSILWAVRDDGVLVSLTHVKEQQILAWCRHDFEGGFCENVVCCREENEDVVYAIVRRTVQETTKRYYERLPSRNLVSIDDAKFMDSFASYDGTNLDGELSMKINDPTAQWTYDTEMDLQSSLNFFTAATVGNQIHITVDGEIIRFTISSYTDAQNVKGYPHKTVPVSMRNVAHSTWGYAIKVVGNLFHLNGFKVSAFADGNVVASVHNNEVNLELTVENGEVTLDKCYVKICIGMPITADLETLNIDTIQGETLVDKLIQIGKVTLEVEESRGIFAGPRPPTGTDYLENMDEVKPRYDETYEQPNKLITGKMDVIIQSSWRSGGRVFIRQVDPLPMSILSVSPSGLIPYRGGA